MNNLITAISIPKTDEIYEYSNPKEAQRMAFKYAGLELFKSSRKDKKYMILNPYNNKFVHFGAMKYEDYTKHKDEQRRERYLRRANNIRGDWKADKYSPNNLAINILW